ncbi:MAG: hypothetical protein GY757_01240 [bacterium]|nr:hypothetical protein [bacterium]
MSSNRFQLFRRLAITRDFKKTSGRPGIFTGVPAFFEPAQLTFRSFNQALVITKNNSTLV